MRQLLPTLTKAHDVHNLTLGEAVRNYPVHLTGVVTYYDLNTDPRHPAFFVSDASGAIFVNDVCAALSGRRSGGG